MHSRKYQNHGVGVEERSLAVNRDRAGASLEGRNARKVEVENVSVDLLIISSSVVIF